jgi:5'-3' exonuclease
MESKEMSDRAKYREMLQSIDPVKASGASDSRRFSPVLSGSDLPTFKPSPAEQDLEDNMLSRIGNLLQYSVSSNDKSEETLSFGALDDSDTKGRYYFDKFGFTPFDAEKHIALRKAYIEGLVWTLKYYYQGVVSWDWYYPYHYGTS